MKTILIIIAAIVIYRLYTTNKNKKRTGDYEIEATLGDGDQNYGTPAYDSLDQWKKDAKEIWRDTPQTIKFSYRDADGDKSRREVDIRKVTKSTNGRIYLHGFCHLRNEERTFRADKIEGSLLCAGKSYETYEWMEDCLKIPLKELG